IELYVETVWVPFVKDEDTILIARRGDRAVRGADHFFDVIETDAPAEEFDEAGFSAGDIEKSARVDMAEVACGEAAVQLIGFAEIFRAGSVAHHDVWPFIDKLALFARTAGDAIVHDCETAA